MSKKATDIVSYLSPIGFIIAFLVGSREESKFHMNQALVLIVVNLVLTVLQKIIGIIPLLGTIINILLGLLGFVVFIIWIIAIIGAIKGEEKPMPLLGGIKLI